MGAGRWEDPVVSTGARQNIQIVVESAKPRRSERRKKIPNWKLLLFIVRSEVRRKKSDVSRV